MTEVGLASSSPSVNDMLAAVDLRGRSWCFTDIAEAAGFSVKTEDVAFVHVVLSGEVALARTGGEPLRLSSGQGVVVLSGEAHAIRTSSSASTHNLDFLAADRDVDVPATFAVGRSGNFCTRLLSARLRVTWPDRISRSAYPAVVQLRHQDHDATALEPTLLQSFSVGPGASVVLTRLASAMLADALRHDLLVHRTRPSLANHPVDDARRMVEANPGHDWTVESLARRVGMGRSNFSAQFSATFGKPPMEFVTDIRMQCAADLLRNGSTSLYEISQRVGYGCEAAFSRRFLKHFGRSIAAMRAEEGRCSEAAPGAEHFGVLLGPQRCGHRGSSTA